MRPTPTRPRSSTPLLAAVLGLVCVPALRAEGVLVFEDLDGARTRVPAAQVSVGELARRHAVLVRFEGFARPAVAADAAADLAQLRLVGGDLVRGRILGGHGDLLNAELVGGSALGVDIDGLASIVFPGRLPAEGAESLQPGAGEDRLYWKRPGGLDRVDGTIESFGDEGVTFESVLGSKIFPWDEVAGLFVAAFEESAPAPADVSGDRVAVDLVDGSRLRGRLLSLDGAGCSLELGGDRGIQLPLTCLSELVVDDGRVAFLSDLEPTAVDEPSPFGDDLGMRWPHRADRAVGGGPLVAGGQTYTRGIGVHAPSRLTYDLGAGWTELRGAVAIDDSVLLLPHRGTVEFRVLLDGEPAWSSGVVRGGQPPQPIPSLPLAGAHELTLEVDMATELHVADRADWLRVMLVRR